MPMSSEMKWRGVKEPLIWNLQKISPPLSIKFSMTMIERLQVILRKKFNVLKPNSLKKYKTKSKKAFISRSMSLQMIALESF